MTWDQLKDILQIVAPIAAAFVSVGGIGAYFAYKGGQPKNQAEAEKINAEVVVTFAEGWKNYAEKLETRLKAIEERTEQAEQEHREEVAELHRLIEEQDLKYKNIISQKDEEIAGLKRRITSLEEELERYKRVDTKVDVARQEIHDSVDSSIDQLKKE